MGMLEFEDRRDADNARHDLDNRRVQGSEGRLKVYEGDIAADGTLGKYQGHGQYGGGGGGSRRKDSRSPPRRRSRSRSRRRSPPRRGGGDGEEIMTLFVKDLPVDARDDEVKDDISRSAPVLRAMVSKKEDFCCA